jgi:hypothetical protein
MANLSTFGDDGWWWWGGFLALVDKSTVAFSRVTAQYTNSAKAQKK